MSSYVTSGKDRPRGKSVLLFSGGMDCLMASHILQPDVLLYCAHGQKYEKQERRCLEVLQANGDLPKGSTLVIDTTLSLGAFERDDAIIPSRNLLFLTVAAYYGEQLTIGALDGDGITDKSSAFFQRVEDMMNFLYTPHHWCEGRTFTVTAPFKHLTKTELTALFLSKGGNAGSLLRSFSCYSPEGEQPCGWCKSCFRKWVALENNCISSNGLFARNPWDAPWLDGQLPEVLQGARRGREDLDWARALRSVGRIG